jgi:hypothetical protein
VACGSAANCANAQVKLASPHAPMKPTNFIYTGLPTTIFEEMSRLAMAHKAVNLARVSGCGRAGRYPPRCREAPTRRA